MADPILQKTYKIEITISVRMAEVGESHPDQPGQGDELQALRQLQQALVQDEPTLSRQMLATAFGQLQEYLDHQTAADPCQELRQLAERLETTQPDLAFPDGADFADLTRPLRVGCMSAEIQSSQVLEKVCRGDAPPDWKLAWDDLLHSSELGRQMADFGIPSRRIGSGGGTSAGHHLLVHSLTRQGNGVYLTGQCSCGASLEGFGEDEGSAFQQFWAEFIKHSEACCLPRRIGENQDALFSDIKSGPADSSTRPGEIRFS